MCKGQAVIELSIDPPAAVATMRRPPVNAIDDVWVEHLNRVVDEVEGHNGVSVLHIRSAQKVFCAGADLGMVRELLQASAGRDTMISVTRSFQAVFAGLEKSPLVTVAEISGAAMGGGLELAAPDFCRAPEPAMPHTAVRVAELVQKHKVDVPFERELYYVGREANPCCDQDGADFPGCKFHFFVFGRDKEVAVFHPEQCSISI